MENQLSIHEKINAKSTCEKRGQREGLGNYYVLFYNGLIN